MYTPDVWDRNLTSLIRSGAFNEKRSVEPMSVYKWTKLIDYFEEEGIIDVFSDGASLHYYDEEFNACDADVATYYLLFRDLGLDEATGLYSGYAKVLYDDPAKQDTIYELTVSKHVPNVLQ